MTFLMELVRRTDAQWAVWREHAGACSYCAAWVQAPLFGVSSRKRCPVGNVVFLAWYQLDRLQGEPSRWCIEVESEVSETSNTPKGETTS